MAARATDRLARRWCERHPCLRIGGRVSQRHEPPRRRTLGRRPEADVPRLRHGTHVDLDVAERPAELARPLDGLVEILGTDDVEAR